ncbi:hypothetical protein GCM10010521_26860 [Streptomyces rameus]|uniref:Uncharacterized protein n=1 Tax=Streptomyces rameus TaxID=68261 RepID=A0ABP6N7R3_9ACTN
MAGPAGRTGFLATEKLMAADVTLVLRYRVELARSRTPPGRPPELARTAL